jgi:ubiquinone/menaquinone biosynthesis C-methylase UbiE
MIDRMEAVDLDLLRLRDGDLVLDMGSGTGRHVLAACQRPCRVVGLDSDLESLALAGRYVNLIDSLGVVKAGATLMLGWCDRLPFADASFDRILCTEVLEHIPDDRATIREIMRVLRPGGTVAVSVPDHLSESIFWRLSWQYRNTPGGHVHIYSRWEVASKLKDAGLRLYAVRFRHAFETLYWLARIGPNDHCWKPRPWVESFRKFLDSKRTRNSKFFYRLEEAANYLFAKSIVFYGRKPVQRA